MTAKSKNPTVRIAESDADIGRCYLVMEELRPHVSAEEFVPQIRRQMQAGFRLAWVEDHGKVVAVAGFRRGESLFHGRFLYVDDLVTTESGRSRGHGKTLLDWLADHGREHGCRYLELDSGVQRFEAHRFYLREGMQIRSHHFSRELGGKHED